MDCLSCGLLVNKSSFNLLVALLRNSFCMEVCDNMCHTTNLSSCMVIDD